MKRKRIYILLALPFVVFAIYLLALPGPTRATFISEFKHRTALMFGYKPKPLDGPKGLRIERPEEYGLGAAAEEVAETPLAAAVEEGVDEVKATLNDGSNVPSSHP